jgi:SAM-dependent methyltransferase
MLLSMPTECQRGDRELSGKIRLRCPKCGRPIGDLLDELPGELRGQDTTLVCSSCLSVLPRRRGVWRALLPEREAHFARFIEEYQFIRASEGRGSANDDYYLALPHRDLSGRNRRQWAIRARTFRYIERKTLPSLRSAAQPPLRILDLGAGNGWMSYRLAAQGHAPIAVDLMTNDQDGLEAAEHYRRSLPSLFPRFQAEADNLPFADAQFDLVIFNASFHYSENYEKTLAEALRCIRRGGTIMIADTPWYADEQSGLRMLEERRSAFMARYGFPSDGIKSLEYLTDRRLARMEAWLGIRWRMHEPYYGLRWQMRPWIAKLRHKRPPSHFRIYIAKVLQ